jgi:hypothetical protein
MGLQKGLEVQWLESANEPDWTFPDGILVPGQVNRLS